MAPRILIVTPTLGNAPTLAATVSSVAAFCEEVDYIIITPKKQVQTLEKRFPGVRIVAESADSSGLYGALQTAFNGTGAQYDWVGWINDDDLLEPGFSEVISHALLRPELDLIYGRVQMIAGSGAHLMYAPMARSPWLANACAAIGQIPFTQQGGLIRRSSFEKVGGFSLNFKLGADSDLFFRLLRSGARSKCCRELVATYRITPGQLSSDRDLQLVEHAQITEARKVPPFWRRLVRAWFMCENLPFLIGRIRRHGFRTVRAIMESAYSEKSTTAPRI
jgi:GT2 family glycosyltransferase